MFVKLLHFLILKILLGIFDKTIAGQVNFTLLTTTFANKSAEL